MVVSKSLTRPVPVVPYLQPLSDSVNVERELERLQGEAETDPERHRQLAAIRFYLRSALYECTRGWLREANGITNYKTLLDQIRHYKKEAENVCLVTFNYDTLLEDALPSVGVSIDGINDYVGESHSYSLVKVHGSIDWWREVETPLEHSNTADIALRVEELIVRANELNVSQRYQRSIEQPKEGANGVGVAFFPAIAIPLERKLDFECPPDHLAFLKRFLTKVTKLLIVGWRGADEPFIDLLKNKIPSGLQALVVAKDETDAREVVNRLNNAGLNIGHFSKTGFSEFVVQRQGEDFLRSS